MGPQKDVLWLPKKGGRRAMVNLTGIPEVVAITLLRRKSDAARK